MQYLVHGFSSVVLTPFIIQTQITHSIHHCLRKQMDIDSSGKCVICSGIFLLIANLTTMMTRNVPNWLLIGFPCVKINATRFFALLNNCFRILATSPMKTLCELPSACMNRKNFDMRVSDICTSWSGQCDCAFYQHFVNTCKSTFFEDCHYYVWNWILTNVIDMPYASHFKYREGIVLLYCPTNI